MKTLLSFACGVAAGCCVLLYFQGPSLCDAADAPGNGSIRAKVYAENDTGPRGIEMDPGKTVDPEITQGEKKNAIGIYTSYKFGWEGQTYGMTPQVGILYYRRIGDYSIGGGPVFTAEQFGFCVSALRHF